MSYLSMRAYYMSNTQVRDKRQVPFYYHGIFAGTAGSLGICVVQPADLVKTRMQLLGLQGQKPTFMGVTRYIFKNEGFLGLYAGLSCAVFRQCTYQATRFTIFFEIFESYKSKHGHPPSVLVKICMGIVAGVGGAVVGNPAEVTLIRMTADGMFPPEQRRGYKHVFDALYRITKEEGILTLWRGVSVTITRAMITTTAELGSYAQCREMLAHFLEDGFFLHLASSMVAGLCATAASLPVDIVKTRIQNSAGNEGQLNILKNIIKKEGVLGLWAGFLPTYAKLGPHAVLTFVILEQFYILHWKFTNYYAKKR